jgi:hypothetical protein
VNARLGCVQYCLIASVILGMYGGCWRCRVAKAAVSSVVSPRTCFGGQEREERRPVSCRAGPRDYELDLLRCTCMHHAWLLAVSRASHSVRTAPR